MTSISRRQAIALGAAGLVIGPRPAAAHHGWGNYDPNAPVQTAGAIERATFENPHGTLWLATPGKTWEVVLAPPSRMRSRGLSQEMLATGTEAEVMGYPHRSREVEMRAEWIRVGGATIQLR
jgi:Family of unknown function (DUF6152)